VTTYANATLDVQDILKALSKNTPDWAAAAAIWSEGKNSFRNLETGVKRIMKLTMERNFGAENYFAFANAYYGEATYASRPIEQALLGQGDFAADGGKYGCCAVRQAYVGALARFYGPLYFYHESDAGQIKAGQGKIETAFNELDDAVACVMAPRVVRSSKASDNGFKISGRVGPGYNFWDWSAAVAKGACAVRSGKADVPAKLLAAFTAAKATVNPGTATDPEQAAAAYADKLLVASRPIAATFVRAALASAREAAKTYTARPSASKCSTSCAVWRSHLAYAHAYWYIAESALARLGAAPEALRAVRDLVDPAVVTARRDTGTKFAAAVKPVVESAGFSFRKDVYLCA
jgi:hypothetical protein